MFVNDKRVFPAVLLILVTLLAACGSTNESPEQNGTGTNESVPLADDLNVAMIAQPPNLDPHLSATLATRDITKQIYETLITVDADYNPVPMLAESVDESEDGKTYTFHLREGITFHNGKEMTSEDVVASMNRWVESNNTAQVFLEGAEFTADGDYQVILEVENPSVFVLSTLGATTQIAAIMPKEIIDSAPSSGITEFVGTGPLQFEAWNQDQHIHLTRYDDYQSVDGESDGLSGQKEVFVENVYFHFVPDVSTQLTGLQTGQYDLLLAAPLDNYEMLSDDPNIDTLINDYGPSSILFNTTSGVFTDVTMRQAVNAGLNLDDMLEMAYVHEDIYEADSSYVSTQNETWYSDAGDEFYNINDPEQAQALFEEAGYNGEEIKILGTRESPHNYNASVVLQQQLENLGLNVSLEIFDWPTALNMRNNEPENWDLFFVGDQFFVNPIENYVFTHEIYRDLEDPKVQELIDEIKYADTIEEAQETWHELQRYSWEHPPLIKVGNGATVSAFQNNVEDYDYLDGPILWNTKVQE